MMQIQNTKNTRQNTESCILVIDSLRKCSSTCEFYELDTRNDQIQTRLLDGYKGKREITFIYSSSVLDLIALKCSDLKANFALFVCGADKKGVKLFTNQNSSTSIKNLEAFFWDYYAGFFTGTTLIFFSHTLRSQLKLFFKHKKSCKSIIVPTSNSDCNLDQILNFLNSCNPNPNQEQVQKILPVGWELLQP